MEWIINQALVLRILSISLIFCWGCLALFSIFDTLKSWINYRKLALRSKKHIKHLLQRSTGQITEFPSSKLRLVILKTKNREGHVH